MCMVEGEAESAADNTAATVAISLPHSRGGPRLDHATTRTDGEKYGVGVRGDFPCLPLVKHMLLSRPIP